MRILFFADFHLNGKAPSPGIGLNYTQSVILDKIDSMAPLLLERYKNEKISLIAFLGDYPNGKNPEEDKKEVSDHIKNFAKELETKCSTIFDDGYSPKDRIIFIDGNHDVSREGDHHKEFEDTFGEYLTPFTKADKDSEIKKYGAPVFDFAKLKLRTACISTTSNAGAHFINKNLKDFEELIQPLEAENPKIYSELKSMLEKQQSVDIGSITEETLSRFKQTRPKRGYTNIVITHHPLIQMQHATATHFETVNGPSFFDNARAKGFTYFVSGHLHEFYCADIISRGKDSDLPPATIISVPQFVNMDNNAQRFVELEIDERNYICRLLEVDNIRDRIEEKDVATNSSQSTQAIQAEHTLLDYEIQRLIEENKIIIKASTDRIQAASYDCALGFEYKKYNTDTDSWAEELTKMEPDESGPAKILIKPGERVLLYTHEEFHIPKDMLLQASPRASWNRRGLNVDLSYFAEPGFEGAFCFPVKNDTNSDIEINAQEAIMSVVLRTLSGPVNRGWNERRSQSENKKQAQENK